MWPILPFHQLLGTLAGVLCLTSTASAASIADWKTRSVYHTMTDRFALTNGSTDVACNNTAGLYCGGSWKGTINKLDYIQGMGFDAVMISPIPDNVKGRVYYGEAYHGFWPIDLYSLNSHFGTSQDLLDLSQAVHDRGMYLLVDTVINNMAYITNGSNPATSIDYSAITPFDNEEFYHSYCKITNWNNFTDAQICQTGDDYLALPDLYTEHADVQSLLINWTTSVVDKYSIDGLRIDAAKSVTPSFLKVFQDKVGMFMTGEVMNGEIEIICDYQTNYIGSLINYPMYYSMLKAFTLGNTTALALAVDKMKNECPDINALVIFAENHDVERFASFTDDMSLAKNAITFTMLFDGIPFVWQGQEQHYKGIGVPENRAALWFSKYNTDAELYKFITTINKIRKHAIKTDSSYVDQQTSNIYRGSSDLAFKKGSEGRQLVMLLSTQGVEGKPYEVDLWTAYGASMNVTEVLYCKTYMTNDYSSLVVEMDQGLPRVFYPTEYMEGSGLCGYSSSNATYMNRSSGHTSQSLGVNGRHVGNNHGALIAALLFSMSLIIVAF